MLERIAQAKIEEVKSLQAKLDIDQIQARKEAINPFQYFKGKPTVSIIAEIKKASPVKGVLCAELNPREMAGLYEENGAVAISVITDSQFFQGNKEYLGEIREEVSLPLLRKDFIIDELQLYESILLGADLVLLIVAMHNYKSLLKLSEKSLQLRLQPLVEVHDRDELNMALDLPVNILGINNRNLKNFQVDIKTSLQLSEFIPDSFIKVSESGISTTNDMQALEKHGFDAALIGESLVSSPNPGGKLRELVNY